MADVDNDVIVVGAGPVGLMLAGELRLGGADVVVLERRAEPTTESRASTLHARTMEIFDSRALWDRFGELPGDVMGHFGGIPLDLTLPGPYPGQWKAPQVRTEAVLQEWALSLGARLRRGHELTGLRVHPDHVEAEVSGPGGPVRVRARYLVGCDGEHSTVRRLTGAAFPGREAERELIRADVDGIEIPARRFQRLERGLAIAARNPQGVTRVMVHEFGSAAGQRTGDPGFADICDTWRRVTGEDLAHGTPLWVNSFHDAARQLTGYRHGRVLFAGDAAHQQMPIGGQALNLGLQDAVNLGWKLALRVTGRAPDALLDTYHTERHAVGARVLGNIGAQATLLLGGPEVEPLRAVIGELVRYEPVRRRLAGMISGLDIRHDVGAGAHPLLGARLIHRYPPSPGRGVLIDLYGDEEHHARLRRAAAPWADRVDTVAGTPEPGGELPAADAVLVRPDGHVVWIASAGPAGPQPLVTALRRWFGEPASPDTVRTTVPGGAHSALPTTVDRRDHMSRLAGKTALVTGSSRGIGRAVAVRLAREGALVAVHCATGREAAEEVVASIEKDGGRAFAVQAELGVPGDVHQLFLGVDEGLKERTGSASLDILVNNAGVMGGVSPEDTTPETFDRLFAINARAPFFIIQRALAGLAPGGRVINISSGLTRFANPEEIAYAMTKGAIEQLSMHFAKYLAPRGITVNSVAPGITRNGNPVFDIPEAVEQMAQLSAFGRVGEPQDVADVVAFLATDDARWITGAFIDATGGTLLG
ncbi:SDR family oxidoreductase [Streptomyces benahoarensis]|uniref:SDR family oxidoreductase n=1 Tax=Streptomyces benahoarensis TaxID=2595054 RepID=A0A553ZNX0_9ACTN|nr:SDR family oxidoreductase [Streptomyces benahoarensis]TSB26784.1 SDR family oxidoreductase [Streptomyces benahoarensis]TSB43113.1 SDR family oxidoreductase [Streptomyces benahoarensis]